MRDICKETLSKIKQEKINLKPRWYFSVSNYFLLAFFVFSVILGSLSFSIILTQVYRNDWDMYQHLPKGGLKLFMINLPYLWLLVSFIFSIIALYNFRNSKTGYYYRTWIVYCVSIFVSVTLGTGLFYAGIGNKVDEKLAERVPKYNKIFGRQIYFWSNPESGLLGGIVVKIKTEKVFNVKDFNGNVWEVNYIVPSDKEIFHLEQGHKIKMVGYIVSKDIFNAKVIVPWDRKPLFPPMHDARKTINLRITQ